MNRPRRNAHRTLCCWTQATAHPTAHVRRVLRAALEPLGLTEETVDDVILAVSEIAANATEHAQGPYELRLRTSNGFLIVEVHDRSHQLPVLSGTGAAPEPAPAAVLPDRLGMLINELSERGRGLDLVHTLVHGHLSARRTPNGKAVAVAVPMR